VLRKPCLGRRSEALECAQLAAALFTASFPASILCHRHLARARAWPGWPWHIAFEQARGQESGSKLRVLKASLQMPAMGNPHQRPRGWQEIQSPHFIVKILSCESVVLASDSNWRVRELNLAACIVQSCVAAISCGPQRWPGPGPDACEFS